MTLDYDYTHYHLVVKESKFSTRSGFACPLARLPACPLARLREYPTFNTSIQYPAGSQVNI